MKYLRGYLAAGIFGAITWVLMAYAQRFSTIVDKTLATMYNIEALGDGWFEFRPTGANTQKIKTTSIKLNVFVRGMEIRTNAKGEELSNGTVTLKLTVK